MPCSKLKNPANLSKNVKDLYSAILRYRTLKEDADSDLRYRVFTHVEEIKKLQGLVRELEGRNRSIIARTETAEARVVELEAQLALAHRKIISTEVHCVVLR